MIMTCTRRSVLMSAKPCRITASAPEYFSVFRSRIAPKMIIRISNVMNRPWIDAAATALPGIPHTETAMTAVNI